MGLPGWDVWEVEVTPLLGFDTRREHERRLGEVLQQQQQQQPVRALPDHSQDWMQTWMRMWLWWLPR